jgi:hypothetical protein
MKITPWLTYTKDMSAEGHYMKSPGVEGVCAKELCELFHLPPGYKAPRVRLRIDKVEFEESVPVFAKRYNGPFGSYIQWDLQPNVESDLYGNYLSDWLDEWILKRFVVPERPHQYWVGVEYEEA